MSNGPWDPRMSAAAAAVDHCMKLGGVILKPASKPTVGFSKPEPPREPPRP